MQGAAMVEQVQQSEVARNTSWEEARHRAAAAQASAQGQVAARAKEEEEEAEAALTARQQARLDALAMKKRLDAVEVARAGGDDDTA